MESLADYVNSLKCENDCLKAKLKDVKSVLDKNITELKFQHEENQKMQFKIKFLEGQIEAYQFAMNCRR